MPGLIETAYPTTEAVMNRARAFVNDAFNGGAGRILTDAAPFTVEYLNAAIEELQDELDNVGVISFIVDNVILTPVTPVVTIDPEAQVSISYTGYFDGTTNHDTPALPSDCILVERLWETITGSALPFRPMIEHPSGALPSRLQGTYLCDWEYRGDAIYMLGSTSTEDIRIRYHTRFLPVQPGSISSDVQINILASTNAIATLVAYNYARARGALQSNIMQADAEKQKNLIKNRYIRRAQQTPANRIAYNDDQNIAGPWIGFPTTR